MTTIDSGAHVGMNGHDVTASIEKIVALQFPINGLACVTYQSISKYDIRSGQFVEIPIIDIEVNAQSLRWEYPNLAVMRVCAQGG